jgi:L-rhamnose isomerase/sugar isomerase
MDAFATDVRPLLAQLREELGADPDPVEAFRRGGYAERLARERGTTSVESAYERA